MKKNETTQQLAETNTRDLRTGVTSLVTLEKPHEDFLFSILNDWLRSEAREEMLLAQSYYSNKNEINERVRTYIDRQGVIQEAKNLSNARLSHPFLRKLTNQKVNYLLSREMSFKSDSREFNDAIAEYLNDRFRRILKNVGRDSIVNGIGWLQVFYNEEGELKFKRIPPEQIIPFWKDSEHTLLDGALRFYDVVKYHPDGVEEEIRKVEYYTVNGVWYFVQTDDGFIPDPDKERFSDSHFKVKADKWASQNDDEALGDIDGEIDVNWQRVPFIAFKYNTDEMGLLSWIKPLIDDYDTITSDTSNNLQDIPNSIKVVRNYDGTDKGEFTRNLAVYRTAFVREEGDVKVLQTTLDTKATESHLDRLRRDIYEFGHGVDTQAISVGYTSGVALKFKYADLDTDTDDLATEFKSALYELIWFIKIDLVNRGLGDYLEEDIEIIFNTDMIINETETIQDTVVSASIVSRETCIANHPWVIDVQAELDRLEKEKKEEEDAMLESFDVAYGAEPKEQEQESEQVVDE